MPIIVRMTSLRRRTRFGGPLLLLLATAACGGGDGGRNGPPTGPPPEPPPVKPVVAARVVLSLGDTTILVGDDVALRATVYDSGGAVLADRAVTYATSDAEVATVAADVLGGAGYGVAQITAQSGAATATARIVVQPRIVELPLPPGTGVASLASINNAGAAVGTGTTFMGENRPFIHTPTRGYEWLLPPGGRRVSVHSLNDREEVAGYVEPVAGSGFVAFELAMWTPAREFVSIGRETPAVVGLRAALPAGINSAGMIAFQGWEVLPYLRTPAGVYQGPGRVIALGEPGIFGATSINDRGDVGGAITTSSPEIGGYFRAAVWLAGAPSAQFLAGAPLFTAVRGLANGPAGAQAAGTADILNGPTRELLRRQAFYWSAESGYVPLDAPAAVSSMATGINDRGEVVGDLQGGSGSGAQLTTAFVWRQRTGLFSLPTPRGHTNASATSISESGLVAGSAFTPAVGRRIPVIWQLRRLPPGTPPLRP